MNHPFGWDLPPGVTSKMIDEAHGDRDHHKSCPCHENAPETEDPECICLDLEEQAASDAAEAKLDAIREEQHE